MKTANRAYTVLLVDDQAFVRTMMARLLSQFGTVQILEAANGRDALGLLDTRDSQIDFIVCDLDMPDMDGIELIRHLAERETCPALVFLSGVDSGVLRTAETLARAYDLKVLGVLAKPPAAADLERIFERVSDEYTRTTRGPAISVTEERLRRAIETDELCLHYQPKVRLDTGQFDSFEAVARWKHPDHGIVGPDLFVPLAESSTLIDRMTEKLVEQAFRQQAEWRSEGLGVRVAINLSPSMLSDVALPDRFTRLASSLGLTPENIVFEITETGVAKVEAIYLEIVARLHLKGFALSIDDFGTGQSSLKKLEALPFSELKIDRQFVHGASANQAKRAILAASIGLAKSLRMKAVAEGVERTDDWHLLKELDCDVAQGFFIAKPLPPPDARHWIESWSQRLAAQAPAREPS
jgi:EAL domain-containing protein (putative c-di-GMP-specific phosphodiesterase class I)/DNA-binding NarL/FixJ family response regulator